MERIQVFSPKAPKPVGSYSHGYIVNGIFYSAGQIGLDPETNEVVTGPVEEEARQVMKNIGALLEAAGSSFDSLIKVNLYITDLKDFVAIDNVYKEFVTKDFPGRTCVEVKGIPKGGRMEIEVIALVE
ncbi:MAG: reactive intermediate/imine deaminase [Firmicutes bacterium]|nr:reactive intermediate/imine deaminase [Bacillota bacterium]